MNSRGMVFSQHVFRWLHSDYLSTLWEYFHDNWTLFWDSDIARELTKPHVLKLFGLAAVLGALFPIAIMILWRLLKRNDGNDYRHIDEDKAPGRFNKQVLEAIRQKKKSRRQRDDAFDPISSKEPPEEFDTVQAPKNREQKKYRESTSLLDASPSKDEEDNEKEEAKATPDSKLNDKDVETISHMQFHGKLKSATLRARAEKLEEAMSAEEREKERKLKTEQLEKIFKMMQTEGSGSKFGITNKEELLEQFKIYGS